MRILRRKRPSTVQRITGAAKGAVRLVAAARLVRFVAAGTATLLALSTASAAVSSARVRHEGEGAGRGRG